MKETTKTIPIEQLKLGMYIERLDRSWLTTPFFRHRFVLRDEEDITLLKRYGIKCVVIDPTKGLDVEERRAALPIATPGPASEPPPTAPSPANHETPARPACIPSREEVAIARLVHTESVTAINAFWKELPPPSLGQSRLAYDGRSHSRPARRTSLRHDDGHPSSTIATIRWPHFSMW